MCFSGSVDCLTVVQSSCFHTTLTDGRECCSSIVLCIQNCAILTRYKKHTPQDALCLEILQCKKSPRWPMLRTSIYSISLIHSFSCVVLNIFLFLSRPKRHSRYSHVHSQKSQILHFLVSLYAMLGPTTIYCSNSRTMLTGRKSE